MRDYFADELLLIIPVDHPPGLRLLGEAVGAHKAPLAVALTERTRTDQDIVVDLTDVYYLANSVLDTLVAVARSLPPPQRLVVRAAPELTLCERLAARGWDRLETLRLTEERREA